MPSQDTPIPSGLCQCGCGKQTGIVKITSAARGVKRGDHARYFPSHSPRTGSRHKKIAVDPDTECWTWQGTLNKAGYGIVQEGGRDYRAHRWFYEQKHGPIPDEKHIHHSCGRRSCVNPDHLLVVSPADHNRLTHVRSHPRLIARKRLEAMRLVRDYPEIVEEAMVEAGWVFAK